MNETNLLFVNLGHAEKTRSEMLKKQIAGSELFISYKVNA